MPPGDIDEEEPQALEPATLTGASPLVASAPSDAPTIINGSYVEPPKPVTYERPKAGPPRAPVPWHKSVGIPQPVGSIDPASERAYKTGLERFNQNQMFDAQQKEQRQINTETQQTFQRQHVASERNADTGAVEAVRDSEGNLQYRPGKGPVRYDDSGKAVQTQYDESGPTEVQLDKDANIGTHPDRPNELYRQNKHSAWEYLGTVQEGLLNKDPAVQKSATDAQFAIDKKLHSEVAHDLGEEVANRALAVQGKVQDFQGKAATLQTLNQQLSNFDKDHPGVNETEGHFLTGGSHPTENALALRQQKADIEKQIGDLQSKGYSTVADEKSIREFAKPEMDALKAARGENDSWLAPKEPGDLDRLVANRVATLAEQGRDSTQDPVLQSLEKKKAAMGVGQTPPDKAQGMIAPGNIDLNNRPVVNNPDGSVSTVRSISINEDGKEVLIPTVAEDGSGILSDKEAIAQYRATGKHLGIFASPDAATAYAEKLHDEQAAKVDPVYGPLIAERESLQTAQQQAGETLTAVQSRYETQLEPLRRQIQQGEAQLAPLREQQDRLNARLESLVGMAPMQEGEDPEARQREVSLRVSQLTDIRKKASAQTIMNSLDPIASEVRQREAEMQPIAEAHDRLQSQAQQDIETQRQAFEGDLNQRQTALQEKTDVADAVNAVRQSQEALSFMNATLIEPTSPAFAQELTTAKAEADRQKLRSGPYGAFEPSTLERSVISGAARGLGNGLLGLAQFSEKIQRWVDGVAPTDPGAKSEGTRALANLILKVPGIMAQDANTNSVTWKAGDFAGGVALMVGEAAVNPAILIPQFFGEGYHGQAEAAQQYFDKKALENPNAPRDVANERAVIEKAGVLGGAVNSILAIPFGVYGKAVNAVFGSARANTISNVLKASYERGGAAAVAEDLRVLQAAMIKTSGQQAFNEVAAKSLDQVISEITRTPLQRVGSALVSSGKDAAIFGGVQAAQNLVTKTYNPKTGLFENVPTAAGQGAILGAFFGGIREVAKAGQASQAQTDIRSAAARRVYPREPGSSSAGGLAEGGTPPSGSGGAGPGAGPVQPAPAPEAAHTEIDSMQPSDLVTAEQVQPTQHALRGLLKIANGESMDSLTSVERTSLETTADGGQPRVEMVKGKPVITDATLERVRQIAPTVAQLLPQNEEAQRQSILNPTKAVNPPNPTKGVESAEQPTFSVEVQDAGGETRSVEVAAADEKAARSQVAGTIEPGQGLIRDVTQVSAPEKPEVRSYVPPERFESHVLEQISQERGQPLGEHEETVRNLIKIAAPAYERWSKAFSTVTATLQDRGTAGAAFSPASKALAISLPDLARHASLYQDPSSGEALVRHEAAHAVTIASGAKVVQLFKSAPAALQNAMKEAYRAEGSTDYNYAHELWAYVLAGKVEMAAGRKIKLSGKFLPEQANRAFIAKYKRAFAEVLRFTRNMEGYLRKRGVAEDVIAQWKELDDLFVSKIREVDNAPKDEVPETRSSVPAEQAGGSQPAAAPSAEPAEPERVEPAVANPNGPQSVEPGPGGPANPPESAGSAPQTDSGSQLAPEIKSQLTVRLNLPAGAVGHQSMVTGGNGSTVRVAYIAQEAAESRPSHDSQGRPTKGYDQELQPRDRSLPSYRKQSQNISNSLSFAKVAFFPETKVPATTPELGAPIMTQLGDTLSGNGREIGIRAAYEKGQAGEYKTDFIRNARAFGINPATVRGMKEPILKRVIIDTLSKEDLVRFSQESNESAAMGSNAIEVAGRDATRLTPELLSLFDANYALDSARNQPFLAAYTRDVIRSGEANEANLTGSELERRVRGAVFAYAYGTDATGRAALERLSSDEADAGGKKITNALLTVAPIVARMKTDIATGDLFPLDISAAISRAAQDISEALKNKPVKQSTATALKDMRNQTSLIEADPLEKAVVNFLLDNRASRQAIEQGLSNYVEAVFKVGNPKNAELFSRTVPEPLELFNRSITPEALRGDLNAQAIAGGISEIGLSSKDLTDVPQNERAQYLVARGDLATNSHQKLSTTSDEALFALGDDSGRTTGPQHAAFINDHGEILTRAEMEKAGLPTHSQELKSQPTEGGEHAIQKQQPEKVLQREQEQDGSAGSGRGSLEPSQQGNEATGEVGGGQPAAPKEIVPTLRKGENQGDLLSKQTEEFHLVGEKGTDFSAIQAAKEKAIRDRAQSAKAQLDLFSQSVDKLPDRMQGALRGLLTGDSIAVIGAGNGVAKEGVARLAMEAIRRLRTEVGNTEQVEMLDGAINQELKAQETNDPLKQLMALIDTDILGSLYKKADQETPGQFETGRPDLALGAEGSSIRAAHQYHTDSFQKKTIKGWDEEADRHLSDPVWSKNFSQEIVSRYLAGDNLRPWETRAAMRLIAADSHSLGTANEKLEHATRAFAYARLRSAVGQELASGRDPFKTPEERGREFLSKTFFRLKPEVEAKIEAEPDPEKKADQLSKAMQDRIAQLEKAFSYLAGKGITIDDIFNGSWELHGKGKKLIETEMKRYDVRQQQALKLAQTGTRSAADISKATGLSIADVERINDEFIDQLEKSLTAKVASGLTLENIDLQGALFAQPTEPGAANAKSPEEIKAEVRRIIRGMGFVASKDLGRFKVEKRKKPKLFVPPAPYQGPVPSAEPVPFEKREQGGLEIKAEAPVRLPNENAPVPYPPGQKPPYTGRVQGQTGLPLEKETPLPPAQSGPMDERTKRIFFPQTPTPPNEGAEVPYPEGQAAPYTGRVLGQIGLPLYQEMMIRRGADVGSMDDLIKIGRVAQSLDAKPFDMVYEAWVNNIFSGVATHVANLSGNTLSMAMDFTLQRGMEALLNTIYRDADAPTFSEFKYIAKGILPGIVSGIKRGARAWDTESSVFSRDVLNEQTEILEALDKAGGVPPAIPGKTGRAIRIPIRALLFEDEVFKSMIGQMEVGAQAYRVAKSEGLSGDKMSARMNELVSTPGSKAWSRAVEKAIYLTYQEPTGLTTLFRDQGKSAALGAMAAKAESEGRHRTGKVLRSEEIVVRNLYRAAGFFFPVIRTTYNIFKIGVSAANVLPSATTIPYRLAKAGFYQWKKGKPFVESYSKANQIHDLAQQLIAWTTFATLWGMIAGDEDDDDKNLLLTGSMPYTQTKRGQRELSERATGGTYMLRVGGRNGVYIPYGRVEPIATVLGTVADTVSNIKKMKHGQSLAETGDALLGYFLAQAQSKTFLSGFADLTKALEGSTSFTDVPKKLLLQALVPNLIRQPLRALDEWVRENKSAPAIYQTLPVPSLAEKKINAYGQPVQKGGNAFSRIFLASGIKPTAELEKADRFLLNWNREHPTESWAPSIPPAIYHDSAGKTQRMTGAEQTKFLTISGQRAADKLRSELTESQIQHPSADDLKRIQSIFEDAHRKTKEEMFPKRRVNQVREAFKKAA